MVSGENALEQEVQESTKMTIRSRRVAGSMQLKPHIRASSHWCEGGWALILPSLQHRPIKLENETDSHIYGEINCTDLCVLFSCTMIEMAIARISYHRVQW